MKSLSPSAVIVALIIAAIAATMISQRPSRSGQDSRDSNPQSTASRAEQEQKTQMASADWCVDRRSGFRVRIPESWRFVLKSEALVRADCLSPDGQAGFQIRVRQPFQSDRFHAFVGPYLDDFRSDMEGHWRGQLTVTHKSFTTIGILKGYVISFDFVRGDGSVWFFKNYLFEPTAGSDRLIFAQAGCRTEVQSIHEPHFDAIAASLTPIDTH